MSKMPDKRKVLTDLKALIKAENITKDEVVELFPPTAVIPKESRSRLLGAALYVVGAIIVCAGLAVLIGQNWSLLDMVSRIVFTFGLGVFFLSLGVYLTLSRKGDTMLSETLLAIASVALIIGSGVITHEAGLSLESSSTIAVLSLLLVIAHSLLYVALKSPVVAVAGLAMVVVFIQAFSDAMFGRLSASGELARTVLMFNGAWLIAAGVFFQARQVLRSIASITQVAGAILLLGTAMITMTLVGTNEPGELLWPVIYTGLLGLVVYASITARRKGLLIVASIFLTIFVLYMSGRYFADTLGWPFSLMLAGVAIIAIAFGARRLSSQYSLK